MREQHELGLHRTVPRRGGHASGIGIGLPAMALGAVIGALVSSHTSYTFGPPPAGAAAN